MFNIYHDVAIQASPERVFQAVSDPKELVNWWPQKCSGECELGARFNFFFTPEYDWYGQVITYEPAKAFHIKMTDSDADWDPTSFGYDLIAEEEGTLLQFWHKGWPELNHHFRRSSYCWAILLKGLKDYLEQGIVIPFEKRA